MSGRSKFLEDISTELRVSAFDSIKAAKHGHIGASSSSSELFTSLYFDVLNYDAQNPAHPDRDRVLVRGHVGPLRYKLFSLLGWVDESILNTYRQYDSPLKGHEDMHEVPGVDITPSGSLGMLLSYAVGASIVAKRKGRGFKTYVFLGDGEEQEGNVSEAARHAANIGLDNIVAIMDKNGKQLSASTTYVDSKSDIKKIWEGYGWNVIQITDGHDISEISSTLKSIPTGINQPTLVIAPTVKGKYVPGCMESPNGYHTISSCKETNLSDAIDLLANTIDREHTIKEAKRILREKTLGPSNPISEDTRISIRIPVKDDNKTDPDKAQAHYFNELDKILSGNKTDFYFLNADWIRRELIKAAGIGNNIEYHDTGIREQHMIATAHGISTTDPNARIMIYMGDFLSYRCADQINASAQGKSNAMIIADTSGLSQTQNGKTHQSAGQPGMIFNMPGVKFFEPADIFDMYNVYNHILTENDGINYVRLHRKSVEPLNRRLEDKENIRHYICHEGNGPAQINLVGSGFITQELCKAANKLSESFDIESKVINIVDHKSLDKSFAQKFKPGVPIFVAYNGAPEFLSGNVSKTLLQNGVIPSGIFEHGFHFGDTGTLPQLLKAYRLDASGIIDVIDEKIGIKNIK